MCLHNERVTHTRETLDEAVEVGIPGGRFDMLSCGALHAMTNVVQNGPVQEDVILADVAQMVV